MSSSSILVSQKDLFFQNFNHVNFIYDLCLKFVLSKKQLTFHAIQIEFHKQYHFELKHDDIPLDIQIQISIALCCICCCFQCESGSKLAFKVLRFIFQRILEKKTHNFLIDFIMLLKSMNETKNYHHNIKNYYFFSIFWIIFKNYQSDHQKTKIVDLQSRLISLNYVKKILKYVNQGSIIKTLNFLIFLFNHEKAKDFNWIVTLIDEFRNIGHIKKYDYNIRMLPLLFSSVIIFSGSTENPLFIYLFSLTCSIMCCLKQFNNCKDRVLSNYDIIYFSTHIDEFYKSKDDCDFGKISYNTMTNLLDDQINDNAIYMMKIYFYAKIINDDFNQHEINHEIDHDEYLKKQKVLYNIDFNHHDNIFNDLFCPNNVVFLIKNEIFNKYDISFFNLDKNKKDPVIIFLTKLTQPIDIKTPKNNTSLVIGPINHQIERKKQFFFAMNRYLNDLKMNLRFKYIDFMIFFKIVNVKMNLKNNDTKKTMLHNDNDFKSLSDRSNDIFNYIHQNIVKINYSKWLIISDPFGDFREKNHYTGINNSNNCLSIIKYMYTTNKNLLYDDENNNLYTLKYSYHLYINKRCHTSKKMIAKLYFIMLYKAIFGIQYTNFFEDMIISSSKNENKRISYQISSLLHHEFGQPRYAPYFYSKRLKIRFNTETNLKQEEYYQYTSKITQIGKNIDNFKQNEIDFFYNQYEYHLKPIFHQMYKYTINDTKNTSKETKSLLKNISKLYDFNTNNEKNEFGVNFNINNANALFILFGDKCYVISKILGLDVNVFGYDLINLYQFAMNSKYSKYPPTKYFKYWIWSVYHETPIIDESEETENNHYYLIPPKDFRFHEKMNLNVAKGWLFNEKKFKKIQKVISQWQNNIHIEIEHLNEKKQKSKTTMLNPKDEIFKLDIAWLVNNWYPEVLRACQKNKKMFSQLESSNDYWRFCESHYGFYFIRSFVSNFKKILMCMYNSIHKIKNVV